MRKSAVVLAVAIAGAAFGQLKPAPPNPVQITPGAGLKMETEPSLESARRVPRDEAVKLVKEGKAIWVDVRSKDSFDAGHIKGAINIPLSDLITRLGELPPKKEIITYCA
jgi:3-mercaptopyruvate sulfurtransferase SseA